jgi:hypothetical protein
MTRTCLKTQLGERLIIYDAVERAFKDNKHLVHALLDQYESSETESDDADNEFYNADYE